MQARMGSLKGHGAQERTEEGRKEKREPRRKRGKGWQDRRKKRREKIEPLARREHNSRKGGFKSAPPQ